MSGVTAEAAPKPSYDRISAVGVALLAALAVLLWLQPRWNVRLQEAWFDAYQLIKTRDIDNYPVTVVAIDEKSLNRRGQWPWPRTELAELVRDVERGKPLAIGIDLLMSERDRFSGDSELASAIAAGPVVLALVGKPEQANKEPMGPPVLVRSLAKKGSSTADAVARLPTFDGALGNLDELDRVAAGHGFISVGPYDDVIRRVPLAVRIDDRLVPSFAMEMLRVAVHEPDVRLFVDGPSVRTMAVGTFVAPTDEDGELRVYYSKHDPLRSVSAIDVLEGKVDPGTFQDKLVLVGISALALGDYHNTPLGERMPGSEIHAQVLENLSGQAWLTRPSWAATLELVVFIVLGASLIWATPRWRPGNAALLALGCIAVPIILGIAVFLGRRLVFDAAAPALGLLILFSVLLVLTLVEAGKQRRRLERVVQAQREQAAYISGELEAAKRIQTGLLPRADFLANDRRVELAVSMKPAREVGGDLYDFFLLDDHRLFFLIGDVAGKGLSASMFMAISKALYKSATLRSPNATVSALMQAANHEVSRDNPEMFFVTAFAAILDLGSGELAYCNAGHENPYALSPDDPGFTRLTDAAGPPLCAVDDFPYRDGHRSMRRGELLCLLTDGLVDARNRCGERYGSAGLQALFRSLNDGQRTASSLVDAVCKDLRAFAEDTEAADDVTVFALRWLGPGIGA